MSSLIDAVYDARDADGMIEQRCQTYRELFALNAFRHPDHGRIVAATGPDMAGVVAPRPLAVAAYRLLAAGTVPVFAVGERWVFLTEGMPESFSSRRLLLSILRLPVVAILAPIPLALPTPASACVAGCTPRTAPPGSLSSRW
ncbi:hypothetical protein [Nocardia sp. NBC_01327]|uniref:hypothetical protein n=1 Tax=Nocardia sp. NBC_01327 TaxID=2903593 RepID=UPI002E11F7EC|nr:hypothetical protein OG326_21550 [Nocardia sp. NBC_01327]